MTVTAWNEPAGGTPRGTLVVLPGRGETAASYERFGRRLSADAYRVRLLPIDLDDLDAARVGVEKLLADEELPGPKVLVGADSGATLAALLAPELPVDAVVLAGLALPESGGVETWEEEVEARTACPVHRKVISQDDAFGRGGLNAPLPWDSLELRPADRPTLLLHGSADPITPAGAALAPYAGARGVRVRLVNGGRHDVLNDASHRSVAATIVLFLESLKLGPDLPDVVSADWSAAS
ncbi:MULTISPECIES: alpha/beta hydrolase [unclassified Nocardioides]|uniref:alpha/beta hydrolase n=1 Tax=unclassified Nocardioides TaxID=2615069 RepID=UPI0036239BA1